MRSNSMSDFEIAITPLIFELDRRSTAQNVENLTSYRFIKLNFRLDFRVKISPVPQNGGHFENFKIF